MPITLEQMVGLQKGEEGFFRTKKDGFTVVGYNHNGAFHLLKNGDSPIHKDYLEMRFSKFDEDGGCICRPMEKFFNYGDGLTELFFGDIDQNPQNWYFQPKEDGSLINPVVVNNELKFMTKAGTSEVSVQFTDWLNSWITNKQLEILKEYSKIWTINIEFTSPENKIVVDYTDTKMKIISLRNIKTGVYLCSSMVDKFFDKISCPQIEIINTQSLTSSYYGETLEDIVGVIRQEEEVEGVVLTHKSGFPRIKVKTEWYLERHHMVETKFSFHKILVSRPRKLLEIILEETFDDILPQVDEDLREKFYEKLKYYMEWEDDILTELNSILDNPDIENMTAKEFAVNHMHKLRYNTHSLIFPKIRESKYEDITREELRAHLSFRNRVGTEVEAKNMWHDIETPIAGREIKCSGIGKGKNSFN